MEFGFRAWVLTLPMPPRVRAMALRRYGARIGRNVRVHPVRVINAQWYRLLIEDDCYVGADVLLDLAGDITIDARVTVAARAMLFTHQDAGDARVPMRRRTSGVHIESDVFVGAGATLLAGVTLPSGTVVPAGTVVRP